MLVTDDEIVAASTLVGRRWDGGLPSIDLQRPESLVEAAARGVRSLRIRGWWDGTELDADARALTELAIGHVVALVFPASLQTPLEPQGPVLAVVATESGWTIDIALPDGTHDLSSATGVSEVQVAVDGALESVTEMGDDRVVSVILPDRLDESAGRVLVLDRSAAAVGRTSAEAAGSATFDRIASTEAHAIVRAAVSEGG